MLSHYDKSQRITAHAQAQAVPPPPKPLPTAAELAEAERVAKAKARREKRLALDKHRVPTPSVRKQRRELRSQERMLLRNLQPIEKELAIVRQQLAQLSK